MVLKRAVVAGLAVWNYVINKRIPEGRYVPANLAAAAAVAGIGLAVANSEQLGLRKGAGVRLGIGAAGAVAAGSVLASELPATAPLFDDQRVQTDDLAYQALVRIPLGTVVLEEVAFRAVIPMLLDGPDRVAVSLRSAALFGLWHVIPTLNTLDINEVNDFSTRATAVTAGVATTALAGLLFDALRLRSGSVLAPMLMHWSANAVSYALAARRQAEAPE